MVYSRTNTFWSQVTKLVAALSLLIRLIITTALYKKFTLPFKFGNPTYTPNYLSKDEIFLSYILSQSMSLCTYTGFKNFAKTFRRGDILKDWVNFLPNLYLYSSTKYQLLWRRKFRLMPQYYQNVVVNHVLIVKNSEEL